MVQIILNSLGLGRNNSFSDMGTFDNSTFPWLKINFLSDWFIQIDEIYFVPKITLHYKGWFWIPSYYDQIKLFVKNIWFIIISVLLTRTSEFIPHNWHHKSSDSCLGNLMVSMYDVFLNFLSVHLFWLKKIF